MPHRKHSHDDLVEIIRTLVNGVELYIRNEGDADVKRVLRELAVYARNLVEPEEFKAERCDETPDMFGENGQ